MTSASGEHEIEQDHDDDVDLSGTVVAGKYRVGRQLGSGGMGTVWEGTHTTTGTRVAIKFIRPLFAAREEARRRFEIEARAAKSVKSSHAVQVFDYGVEGHGLPYIVMEFLEGESLSEALIRRGPFPPPEAARVVAQAARAVAAAHAVGVVHRDLKPDNIFLATNVSREGSGPEDLPYTVKIVDFGIAKLLDDSPAAKEAGELGGPTAAGTVIGTPNFMSPEQLTVGGTPGPLTDVWSLGACAFSAFTARIPFEGQVLGDIVLKVCVAPMPVPSQVNPAVPEGFDAWFARACHRDPSRRFQSAAELAESLTAVCGIGRLRVATLDEERVKYVMRRSEPDSDLDEEMPTATMSSKTAFMAGLLLAVTLVVGALTFLSWRDQEQRGPAENPPSAPQSSRPTTP